jgi:DNA-binding Xre family transcriptional regulator
VAKIRGDMNNFDEILRRIENNFSKLKEKLNTNNNQIANATGISPQNLKRMLETDIKLSNLVKIADALNINYLDLLGVAAVQDNKDISKVFSFDILHTITSLEAPDIAPLYNTGDIIGLVNAKKELLISGKIYAFEVIEQEESKDTTIYSFGRFGKITPNGEIILNDVVHNKPFKKFYTDYVRNFYRVSGGICSQLT